MNNPTLIAGFEDVMQHIRNQEKRIQELEKENKRLNNEIIWEWNEQVIGLKETIQELEEKNMILTKFKKEAEDTCGSHKVMEDLMERLDKSETQFKVFKEKANEEMTKRAERISEVEREISVLKETLFDEGFFNCECCHKWSNGTEQEVNVDIGVVDILCEECVDNECVHCIRCGELCMRDFIGNYADICQNCEETDDEDD